MLIIKPIQDKEYQKEVCELCGFEFKPLSFAYSEKEDDKLIASCQFDILGKRAVISDFGMVRGVHEDIEALIILGRAVLNFMELSGAEDAVFESKSKIADKYAKMLGFKEENKEYKIVLKGLFDSKCKHECK
ncbi:MAG: hypothetical protein E7582_05330 [Ruminococcaceae bacterium]|nr:hypothetical protein [Oscillospiraceae bacterium]